MRIALLGSTSPSNSIFLRFTEDTSLAKTPYSDYIYYDVIAIGAGGGRGGGASGTDTNDGDRTVRNFGGAGGGGGFHRVQGLWQMLADPVEIIIGAAGADGTDGVSDPGDTTDGEDGGYSRFADFCGAGGGKGGKRAQSLSIIEDMYADGGEGGLGGQTDPGYGGTGGVCGSADGTLPTIAGGTGVLQLGPIPIPGGDLITAGGWVGKGGGGGPGGIASNLSPSPDWAGHKPWAGAGGKGAYDSDEAVFGPGGQPTLELEHYMQIVPGIGGGARLTPLNRSTVMYGGSGQNGVVGLLLSKA